MKQQHFRVTDLAYMAMGAALMAVCAWITVPAAVPFTMQTFGVFCTLGLLGGKRGTVSVLVYILLGAVGAPVFSGFQGGFGVLLGTTGGYIAGFLFSGLVYWLTEHLGGERMGMRALGMLSGLAVCYALGTAWFLVVYARTSGAVGIGTALGWCVVPFLLPDAGKLALALLVSRQLRRRIRLQ